MNTLELSHRSMSVAYDDVGTGLPVVLLHAFPLDRTLWAPQLGPLSAAGFRVLVPDLPEFGDTTPGADAFTIERTADVVADFLESLGLARAVVGGLSMGGYVALAFARRHPRRLDPRRHEGRAGRHRGEGQAGRPDRGREGHRAGRGDHRALAETPRRADAREEARGGRAGARDRPAPEFRRYHRRALRAPRPA